MNLVEILLLLGVFALLVHITRFWPRVAFVVLLFGGAGLVWNTFTASSSSLDIFGVTLAFQPATREYISAAFALVTLLALASLFPRDRKGLSFLFWAWPAWFVALAVNDYVVAVFAWALGFIVSVLAMRPRKYRRTSGAAFFLTLVVLGLAALLLANRFISLYPLTPERTELIDIAVLFLAWGMGILLSIFPFHFWVGPMTDDAPLTVSAAVLGLGQPIGLFLLIRLLSQYPWVLDKSNLLGLISMGGLAALLIGGIMSGVERRAGRLLGYASMFTLGFAIVNLGQASREGLAYAGLELLTRGVGLTVVASAVSIGRSVDSPWVRRASIVAFVLGGLSLLGLRLGVSAAEHWNILAGWAGSDLPVFALVIFAHTGLLVGIVRFARQWYLSTEQVAEVEEERPALVPLELVREEARVTAGGEVATASPAGGNGRGGLHGGPISDAASGNGKEGEAASKQTLAEGATPGDEYVFDEHLREITRALATRLGPILRRGLTSLPVQTQGTLMRIWTSWRVWAGLALLVGLVLLLIAVTAVPGLLFDRMLELFGAPPFVQ